MRRSTLIIICHGSYGSPEENWFPWLAAQLRGDGYRVVVPKFPTPAGQTLANWREVFHQVVGPTGAVGPTGGDMLLVGHSAGAGFILKMLQESQEPVRGTFLVSGFVGSLGLAEFDPINEALFGGDFDWIRIRQNAGSVRVYNSDNDPYVPLSKGQELAEQLGVEVVIVKDGGHINAEAGFTEFPEVLEDIRSVLAR